MKLRHVLIIFALVFFPIRGLSQDTNLGNWLIYFGNKKIESRWNWHHEVQYRNYNAVGDLEQLLLRTGLGYNLSENNHNVLLGYGFIHSQNYLEDGEKVGTNEHRIFQQFISRSSISRVQIQHRYRFEQRFLENSIFRLRFRYFLSLNIPLNHHKMMDRTWYGSVYNEIFLNNRQVVFDRNRLYGGLGFQLNDTFRFESGYMYQFLNGGGRGQINIITFLNF